MPLEIWSAIIQAAVALAVAGLAAVQWHLGRAEERRHRDDERRHRDEAAAAAERRDVEAKAADAKRRDVEMFHWGTKVLDVFAETEAVCAPLVNDRPDRRPSAERLGWLASSLVDQGRLFFPNPATDHIQGGLRPMILDEVLRCCFVARHLAEHGADSDEGVRLAAHVHLAQRRFIELLQNEMKASLKDRLKVKAGPGVDPDLAKWRRLHSREVPGHLRKRLR